MSQNNPLLNIGIKKGTFYLSENAPKDDSWTKQEFKNPQTGQPMVKYHKEIRDVKGKMVYMALRDDERKGMCLNFIIGGETESYAFQIPIINSNGTVKATNEYFNSIVGVFEKLERGQEITIFVNNKNKDKNGRLYRNLVTLDADGKLIKSDFSFNDVPNWESTTSTDDFGKTVTTWNPSPANKFFIQKITAITEKWEAERLAKKADYEASKGDSNNTEPTAKQEPADVPSAKTVPTATPEQAFEAPVEKKPIIDRKDLPF